MSKVYVINPTDLESLKSKLKEANENIDILVNRLITEERNHYKGHCMYNYKEKSFMNCDDTVCESCTYKYFEHKKQDYLNKYKI